MFHCSIYRTVFIMWKWVYQNDFSLSPFKNWTTLYWVLWGELQEYAKIQILKIFENHFYSLPQGEGLSIYNVYTLCDQEFSKHTIYRDLPFWGKYTAIFLINGLCIVYCSLLQCLTLVYPGWGQKSEFFCLLVSTHRLQSGTVVGYHSTATAYCWYTAAKGHWSTPG